MIGVVADDTTGANDIGIMFTNNCYAVKVITFDSKNAPSPEQADVIVIDTDSRLDSAKESYDKVFKATKQLRELNCTTYYNKTCSVFRGNIGAELDAMMDVLGESFAVISLAFPKNGRKTRHGIHRVNGKRLEDSEFAKDPVHPTLESDLVKVLQSQTARKVSLIPIETVRKGIYALSFAISKAKERCNYCIIDSETQNDLKLVAQAIYQLPIICGSSAIAEELPLYWGATNGLEPLRHKDMRDSNGVLIVSGSLTPQTKMQTAALIVQGINYIVMDSRKFFNSESCNFEVERAVCEAVPLIHSGKDVLVMADNNPDIVKETKQIGQNLGLNELKVSKTVSAILAEVTHQVLLKTSFKRLIVAGGDTSGTVTRKLGIVGSYIIKEIETGLPSGLSIGPELLIVLKSGSFGTANFLSHAIQHLKDLSVVKGGE
ncbi:four-carbon acid sugar kinase family protein [Paenibacillus camerounensis]|uniref:four-carbon acid sugar kinase family protein n=1 Tax=Paenibacillus camerounensis TaxID=1243663 RepID=UPI0005A7BEDE|nr:four-carbon acid sugar kinase family protein [Paenibacillus camerounensis]